MKETTMSKKTLIVILLMSTVLCDLRVVNTPLETIEMGATVSALEYVDPAYINGIFMVGRTTGLQRVNVSIPSTPRLTQVPITNFSGFTPAINPNAITSILIWKTSPEKLFITENFNVVSPVTFTPATNTVTFEASIGGMTLPAANCHSNTVVFNGYNYVSC